MLVTMTVHARNMVALGAFNALLAVALGAFGAHALRGMVTPELLSAYQTGVQYHFYHALGLLAVGMLAALLPDSTTLQYAGWTMLAGVVLFSGSLYAMALTGTRMLGAITPLGGVAFLVSWALVAWEVFRGR